MAFQQQQTDKKLLSALKDVVEAQAWHCLGRTEDLKSKPLQRLYGEIEGDDVLLIYSEQNKSFHAMDAVCSHEGGPLDLGDIEELGGKICVVCPWHQYEYQLETGYSESTGLQQDVYPIKVISGNVYIRTGENKLTFSRVKEANVPIPNELKSPMLETNIDCHSLTYAAHQILTAGDPNIKMKLSKEAGDAWLSGQINEIGEMMPPDHPSRSDELMIVKPGKEAKRGKGGTLASRVAILHSMANIELWAVDLTWDIITRFVPHYKLHGEALPNGFTNDFIKIALDETKHFGLLSKRIEAMGSHFGALTVHNGLWESAAVTSSDLLGRLAVVHMVHEARGLDVQPAQIRKFHKQGDKDSLDILNVVYEEEITHVASGMKWFKYICDHSQPPLNAIEEFHKAVRTHFKGYLKPPFNLEARTKAGMTPEWYEPLMKPTLPTMEVETSKQTIKTVPNITESLHRGTTDSASSHN